MRRLKRLAGLVLTSLVLAARLPTASAAEFKVEAVAISEIRLLENRDGNWSAPSARTARSVPGLMQLLTLGLLRDKKARQLLSVTLRARYTGNWDTVCAYGDINVASARDDRGSELQLIKTPADGTMLPLDSAKLKKQGGARYLDIPLVFRASGRAARTLAALRVSMSFRQCERVTLRFDVPPGEGALRHAKLESAGIKVRYQPPGAGPFTFPDMPRVHVYVKGKIENFAGARLVQADGKPLYVRRDSGPETSAGSWRLAQTITLWKPLPPGVSIELEVQSEHATEVVDLVFRDIPLP